jgi:hypothetical protein
MQFDAANFPKKFFIFQKKIIFLLLFNKILHTCPPTKKHPYQAKKYDILHPIRWAMSLKETNKYAKRHCESKARSNPESP